MSAATITPALIVAMAQQKVLDSFEAAGATSPERAIAYTPERQGKRVFAYLVKTDLIRQDGDLFWYDREAHQLQRERTKKKLLWLLPTLLAAVSIAMLLGVRLAR